MDNTLFYTFSTISQTLAGAMGLLAAFVLYRLTSIDAALRQHIDALVVGYPYDSRTVGLRSMWRNNEVGPVLDYFDADPLERLHVNGPDGEIRLQHARHLWTHRAGMLTALRTALAWTAATILFTLLLLVFTKFLAFSPWFYAPALALGLGGVVVCFLRYFELILKCLDY